MTSSCEVGKASQAVLQGWDTRRELQQARQVCSIDERRALQRILNGMKQRCHNPTVPAFKRYGARGITVCERWRTSVAAFIEDMGPRPSPKHSIERMDNDGHYEPGNCKWATDAEQRANQCYGYYVLHNGEPLTIREFTALNQMKTRDVFTAFKDGSLVECCKGGHPFSADNIYTYLWKNRSYRMCKTCRYVQNRKIAARKQAAAGGKKRLNIKTLPPHLARNLGCAQTLELLK